MAEGAKTLVTGATGFVGLHLARELARRGDDLRLLVREESNTAPLEGIEWEPAIGDVTIGTMTFHHTPLPSHQCCGLGTAQIMTWPLLCAAASAAPHKPPISA